MTAAITATPGMSGSAPTTADTKPVSLSRTMPGTPPPTLRRIADRVDARLADMLAAERARWSSLDADLVLPIDEIGRLVLSGGKRLRPAFCHWAYVGAGGGADDQIDIDAGAAFELMHAFALFHDDVMDDAATRRGQPTTHALAEADHAAQGWAGESRRFGEGVAILVGDLAFVYADQLMEAAPGGSDPDLERAAHRTEHRPVPRHPRVGPARARSS